MQFPFSVCWRRIKIKRVYLCAWKVEYIYERKGGRRTDKLRSVTCQNFFLIGLFIVLVVVLGTAIKASTYSFIHFHVTTDHKPLSWLIELLLRYAATNLLINLNLFLFCFASFVTHNIVIVAFFYPFLISDISL